MVNKYKRLNRTWWFLLAVTLLASGTTARLGVWQMDRAMQKEAVFAQHQAQQTRPALTTQDLLQMHTTTNGLYRTVHLQGVWLDQFTVYLNNRTMNQHSGFFVLTPLQIAPDTAVWVQRGWVARDLARSDFLPPIATPTETVEVNGRWVAPPSKLMELSSPAENPESGFQRLRANVDWDLFQIETGLRLLATVQQTQGPNDGLTRDWPSPLSGATKNWGYAFQWFGLSALCVSLFVWFQIFKKRPSHG